jgi:cobalt/nickel transport system permease protein
MLNFTVIGGTSGHLLGAALATILLGPWAAVLVMTCVVGIQALVFQDGGLLVLGANLFNMAVIGVAVSHLVFRLAQRVGGSGRSTVLVGGFAAAWASVFFTSLSVGLQLAVSGTSPANIALPAMAGIHALIGLGEALITVGALSFLWAARRDLVTGSAGRSAGMGIWIGGLAVAVLLAVLSPLASSDPDGLESVAEQLGFLSLAQSSSYQIIPDYLLPGIADERLATILAGVVGLALVLTVSYLVARSRRQTVQAE